MSKAKQKSRGPWNYFDGIKQYNEGKIRESTNVNYQSLTREQLLPIASREFFDHRECKTFCANNVRINRDDEDAQIAYKQYIYSL